MSGVPCCCDDTHTNLTSILVKYPVTSCVSDSVTQVKIMNTGGADKSLARPGKKQATPTKL